MNIVDLPISDFEIEPLIHKEETPMDQTATKTRTLWQKIKEVIGNWIRDFIFLPLARKLSREHTAILEREELFVKQFWDVNQPADLNYPHHDKIREAFTYRDQPIRMMMDGKEIEATCRIIETKEKGTQTYNFVHVLGNLSTISNNLTATYPFLASYLDEKEANPELPPARFMVISQYNTKSDTGMYKPTTLEDSGLVLKKTLETIVEEYGTIQCLAGQSLGSVVVASSLKHLKNETIPKVLNLDRAPSSIEAVSKSHPIGFLLYQLANYSGWTIDIGKELDDFYGRGETSSCVISSLKNDSYFQGPASLSRHPSVKVLQQSGQAVVLEFDPFLQLFDARGHHIIRSDFLNGNYLLESSNRDFLRQKEHFAGALLRHSFERMRLSQNHLVA